MYLFIVAIIIVLLDQISKLAIVNFMDANGINTIALWQDIFHLTSHRNAGAAFGILQNQRSFFLIMTSIVIIVFIIAIFKYRKDEDKKLMLLGISFILGGAIGNLIDRFFLGEVIDFLDFRLINFPIFNIADIAVVVGVFIILLDTWLTYRAESKRRKMINEES